MVRRMTSPPVPPLSAQAHRATATVPIFRFNPAKQPNQPSDHIEDTDDRDPLAEELAAHLSEGDVCARKLFCTNLSQNTTTKHLRDHFKKFGFTDVWVTRRRKATDVGWVTLNAATAEQAHAVVDEMDGTTLMGKSIRVGISVPKKVTMGRLSNNANSDSPSSNTTARQLPTPSSSLPPYAYSPRSALNLSRAVGAGNSNPNSQWAGGWNEHHVTPMQPTPTSDTIWKGKDDKKVSPDLDTRAAEVIAAIEASAGHRPTAGTSKPPIQASGGGSRGGKVMPTALGMTESCFAHGGSGSGNAAGGASGVGAQIAGAGGQIHHKPSHPAVQGNVQWAADRGSYQRNPMGESGGVMLGIQGPAKLPANGTRTPGVEQKQTRGVSKAGTVYYDGAGDPRRRGGNGQSFSGQGAATLQHQGFAPAAVTPRIHGLDTDGGAQPRPASLLSFHSSPGALTDIDSEMEIADEEMPPVCGPAFPVIPTNHAPSHVAPESNLQNNSPVNHIPQSSLVGAAAVTSSLGFAHARSLIPSAHDFYPVDDPLRIISSSPTSVGGSTTSAKSSGPSPVLPSISKREVAASWPSGPEKPVVQASAAAPSPLWANTILLRPEGLTSVRPAVPLAPPIVPPTLPVSPADSSSQEKRAPFANPVFSLSLPSTPAALKSLSDAPPLRSNAPPPPDMEEAAKAPKPAGPSYFDAIVAIEDALERKLREGAKRGPLSRRGPYKYVTHRKRSRIDDEGREGIKKRRRLSEEPALPRMWVAPTRQVIGKRRKDVVLERPLKRRREECGSVHLQELSPRATKRRKQYRIPGVVDQSSMYLQHRRASLPFIEVYSPPASRKSRVEKDGEVHRFDHSESPVGVYARQEKGGLAQDLGVSAYELTIIGGIWLLGMVRMVW